MEEILRVDEESLKKAKAEFKRILSSKYDFYTTLKIKDRESIGMLSRDAYETAESLEDFLATFSAVRECTERYLSSKGLDRAMPRDEFSAFLNMFSTYAGIAEAEISLNLAEKENSKYPLGFIDFKEGLGNPNAYLDVIISSYAESVKKNTGTGKQMKKLLLVLYNSLEDKLMAEKSRYPMLESAVSDIVLAVDSIKLKGFSSHNGKAEERNHVEIDKTSEQYLTFDRVIGNSEAKHALKKYAEMLFLYNPETRKNSIAEVTYIPRTAFLYARPGTGKTSLAAAVRNYMQELSEKTGKKFSWVTVDSSIKKKWYGETEEILKAKADAAMSPDGIGVIFIDDIDGFVVSRDDSYTNAPDKSMTMYLMQLIEGIDTPYFGNYIILSASNKPDDLDEALIERIGEASLNVPGPATVEEYSEFLRSKLEKGIKAGYVSISDDEWICASKLCMKYQETLSPRDLTKAIRMLQQGAAERIPFSEIYLLPPEQQQESIQKSFSKIGIGELETAIEARYRNEVSQHEISQKAEIKRRAGEIERQYEAMKLAEGRVK
ncbi:hypothetical protein COT07_01585 [Candidatus Woesearchaeota archaeon CG07_land_8_20_14_0_80_44_23]|nr:MAG: hypothetical protein COT07_01585 [Candidatus Woesearchaeota archaeon CG07_land_8_20_14_0_80_44_23]